MSRKGREIRKKGKGTRRKEIRRREEKRRESFHAWKGTLKQKDAETKKARGLFPRNNLNYVAVLELVIFPQEHAGFHINRLNEMVSKIGVQTKRKI